MRTPEPLTEYDQQQAEAAEWLNAPDRMLERKAPYQQREAVKAVLAAFGEVRG